MQTRNRLVAIREQDYIALAREIKRLSSLVRLMSVFTLVNSGTIIVILCTTFCKVVVFGVS